MISEINAVSLKYIAYHFKITLVPTKAAIAMMEFIVEMRFTLNAASLFVQPYSSSPTGASSLHRHKRLD